MCYSGLDTSCLRGNPLLPPPPAVDRLTTLGRSDSWRSPRRLGRGRWQEIWKADVCRIRLAPPAHFFQGLACDQSRRQACCLRNIVSAWPYREYSRAGGCCGRLRATRKWKNGPAGVLQNLWTAITPLALRAILAWCGHRPRLVALNPRYRATCGDPSGGGLRWAEGCLKSRPAVNSLCTDHYSWQNMNANIFEYEYIRIYSNIFWRPAAAFLSINVPTGQIWSNPPTEFPGPIFEILRRGRKRVWGGGGVWK